MATKNCLVPQASLSTRHLVVFLFVFLDPFVLFYSFQGPSLAVQLSPPPRPSSRAGLASRASLADWTHPPVLLYRGSSFPSLLGRSRVPVSSSDHPFPSTLSCRHGDRKTTKQFLSFQTPPFPSSSSSGKARSKTWSPLEVFSVCSAQRRSVSLRASRPGRVLTSQCCRLLSPVAVPPCGRRRFCHASSSSFPFARGSRARQATTVQIYRAKEAGAQDAQVLFGGPGGEGDTSSNVGDGGAQMERMQETTIEIVERRREDRRTREEEATEDEAMQEKRRRRLQAWQLVLHNDDVHAIPHVTELLVEAVPTLTKAKAHAITVHAHKTGLALIMKTWREKAKAVQRKLKASGLTVSMIPSKKQEDRGTGGGGGGQGDGKDGGGGGGGGEGTTDNDKDGGGSDTDDDNDSGDDDTAGDNTDGGEGDSDE